MKKLPLVILILFTLVSVCFATEEKKPAVIITQDGEVDDRSSFVRLLLYTPDIDLRGVVATNSKWQKNGHGLDWIYEVYDIYDQVRDNLLLHNPDYPTVEFLKSITVLGNEDPEHLTGNAPYVDSEGSELIVKELLKIEDNLLHINCCWWHYPDPSGMSNPIKIVHETSDKEIHIILEVTDDGTPVLRRYKRLIFSHEK